MPSDVRAVAARQHHRAVASALDDAARHREQRDDLVRSLRAENPSVWTHKALAQAVGCSVELIAVIIRNAPR